MTSGPIIIWQIDWETMETKGAFVFLFWGAPKSLQMVTAAMKLKQTNKQKQTNKNNLAPWEKIYGQPRQHIEKQRYHFTSKGPSSQGFGFSSSHVWMLGYKES